MSFLCNLFSIISQLLIFATFLQKLSNEGNFITSQMIFFLTSSEISSFIYFMNHQIINFICHFTHDGRLNVGDSEATRRQIISNIAL